MVIFDVINPYTINVMTQTQKFENLAFRWVTPMLILIVSYLVKNKLEIIDSKMAIIEQVLIEQGKLNLRIERLEKDMEDSKQRVTTSYHPSSAKKEDEITLHKLQN